MLYLYAYNVTKMQYFVKYENMIITHQNKKNNYFNRY